MAAINLTKAKALINILNSMINTKNINDFDARKPHSRIEWQDEIFKKHTYKTENGAFGITEEFEVSDEFWKGLVALGVFHKQGHGLSTTYTLVIDNNKTIADTTLVMQASVWWKNDHARKANESYARRQAKEGKAIKSRKFTKVSVFTPKAIVVIDGYRFSIGFDEKIPKVKIEKI